VRFENKRDRFLFVRHQQANNEQGLNYDINTKEVVSNLRRSYCLSEDWPVEKHLTMPWYPSEHSDHQTWEKIINSSQKQLINNFKFSTTCRIKIDECK